MAHDEVKLQYVYRQVLALHAILGTAIDHADLRVWGRVRSEPSRKVIQELLDELEARKLVVIDRKPEEERGWILTLVQPLLLLTKLHMYGIKVLVGHSQICVGGLLKMSKSKRVSSVRELSTCVFVPFYELLNKQGWTAAEAAEALGMTKKVFMEIMFFREVPAGFSLQTRELLELLTGETPEQLFEGPYWAKNGMFRRENLAVYTSYEPVHPEALVQQYEVSQIIEEAMDTLLTPEERDVLNALFFEGNTLEDLAWSMRRPIQELMSLRCSAQMKLAESPAVLALNSNGGRKQFITTK